MRPTKLDLMVSRVAVAAAATSLLVAPPQAEQLYAHGWRVDDDFVVVVVVPVMLHPVRVE